MSTISRVGAAPFIVAMASVASACVPARDTAAQAASPSVVGPVSTRSTPGPELPRGGRTIFPDYRLVGFCGTPGAPALGPLLDHPATKVEKLLDYANRYAGSRKILPVFELVAVVVQAYGGPDGKYRNRVPDAAVDEYLQAARQTKGLLLLNIQPGHSDFLSEVRGFERYLHEPDVGVALDPEWAMLPKQQPGRFYGQTTGNVINAVIDYLAAIVARENLPEKVLVFHQVNDYVVKGESNIKPSSGVVVIKSVDGLGPKGTKITTYNFLMRTTAPGVHAGFKVFFDEDRQNGGALMTPAEVLALVPPPEYVMYE
jgi:hypothetical protein